MSILLYFATTVLLSLLLASVFTLVYMFIYQKKIAIRLAKAERNKKEMPAPLHFFLCSFAVVIIFLFVALMFMQVNTITLRSESSASAKLVPCDAEGFMSLWSPESEIPGYQRKEQTEGNFSFVIYMKNKDNTDPFPIVLLYISSEEPFLCDYAFANTDDSSVQPIRILSTSQWFAVNSNVVSSGKLTVTCTNSDGTVCTIVVPIV